MNDVILLPARPRPLHLFRGFAAFESAVGTFWATAVTCLIGLVFGMVIVDAIRDRGIREWVYVGVPLTVVWLLLDVPAVLKLWFSLAGGKKPAAVHAAMRLRALPWALRPLVALWWLAHFLTGLAFIYVVAFAPVPRDPAYSPGADAFLTRSLELGFGWFYCFVANVYLVFAVATLTRSESAVRHVWARRWFIDASIVLASAAWLFMGRSR
jgi:hypothetical protein